MFFSFESSDRIQIDCMDFSQNILNFFIKCSNSLYISLVKGIDGSEDRRGVKSRGDL